MAFLSKFGNILRQTTSMQINSTQLSASRPGIFQVFRCMSNAPSSKLFVGGISYQTDDQSLREAFSKYGEVVEARVIVDRETGRSRGFGFVTYTSSEDASSAIQALDGQDLHGRQVRVNYAAERPPRNFGGGGYGGGGYGGGGGGYGGGGYGGGGYGGGSYGGGGYGGRGGGGYGGGGYGGNADPSSGTYGGNDGYSNTGGSGNYGEGSYGGNNSGTGGVGYGTNFSQSGASNFDSGSFNVAGGGGGSDSFAAGGSGGVGGDNMGFGGGDQLDNAENGYKDEQNDPVNENFRDDDDDTGDFAKRA
ncbi:hypothetical protein PTKIN_Ptkin04bG0058300 [Pterospermum kingtungense]